MLDLKRIFIVYPSAFLSPIFFFKIQTFSEQFCNVKIFIGTNNIMSASKYIQKLECFNLLEGKNSAQLVTHVCTVCSHSSNSLNFTQLQVTGLRIHSIFNSPWESMPVHATGQVQRYDDNRKNYHCYKHMTKYTKTCVIKHNVMQKWLSLKFLLFRKILLVVEDELPAIKSKVSVR